MEYFTNTRHNMDIEEIKNTGNLEVEEFKNTGLLYLLEIIGCVGFVSLCVLINILLVYGALRRKRWFLIHWLLLHLLLLFTISILLYILPTNFYKLVGLVPTIVAILVLYCWVKVYQLFISLRHLPGTDTPPPSCNHDPLLTLSPLPTCCTLTLTTHRRWTEMAGRLAATGWRSWDLAWSFTRWTLSAGRWGRG